MFYHVNEQKSRSYGIITFLSNTNYAFNIDQTNIDIIIIKIITALLQKGNGVVSKIGFINFFLFIDLFNVIVYRATKLFSTMFGLFLEYLNQ